MSTLSYAVSDSMTMVWRDLLHLRRYPSLTFFIVVMPVVFLLLFVYVFGGTIGDGLGVAGVAGASGGGRGAYVNYLVPGILIMTVAGAGQGTAISIAKDMVEGVVARFRTMAIFRPSVLVGHVVGSTLKAVIALAVVLGTGFLVGFRPNATPVEWVAAIGMLLLSTVALVWLCAALGMLAGSVESASNLPQPLVLLPFFGSGFVPTGSMPTALRWFAEYQPFTPIIETVRGLLLGTPVGADGAIAVGWCVAITVGSFGWARHLYARRSTG